MQCAFACDYSYIPLRRVPAMGTPRRNSIMQHEERMAAMKQEHFKKIQALEIMLL